MWHESWGGLPPDEFLTAVDPLLSGLRAKLYTQTFTSNNRAGNLSKEWAEKFGLNEGVSVALGAAIFGAVASGYYKSVEEAQENMASGFSTVYSPIAENVKKYKRLYNLYIELGSKLEDFLRSF